jgi:hypothetical protein
MGKNGRILFDRPKPQWAVVPVEEGHMLVSRTEFYLRPSASHVQNFDIPTVREDICRNSNQPANKRKGEKSERGDVWVIDYRVRSDTADLFLCTLPCCSYTGRFLMFFVITNIYNKKTPNAYAEPPTLSFSTSIAP